MIRPILTCKKLFLAVVLSFSEITLIAADRYSVTTTANAACANYGIYIVSFVSGIYQDSKKIFIQNR